MRPYTTFQTRKDYTVPLLELLAALPGSEGEKRAVLAAFQARFAALIPPKHRQIGPGGRSLWAYYLDWQRQELADAGMLDTPRWGVWHVTALGLRWLQENPAETNLNPARAACARAPQRRERASQSRKVVSFHIRGHSGTLSVEKVLTVAREALAAGLPAEAADYRSWAVVVDGRRIGLKWLFRQATGLDSFNTSHARDILGRRLGFECVQQENALSSSRNARRAPHSASGEEATWLDVARREVRSVRDFLAGRAARPSDERLCDMVQFCYTFGLYSEARDLFPLVDQTLVNVWLYERIRRLAMVSEPKASH